MLAKKITPELIPNTPLGISIYSVSQEPPHYHDEFLEIIYCFKGSITIHSGYEYIEIKEGDILSCNSLDIHSLSSNDDNLVISFYIDLNSPEFHHPNLANIFFICEKYVLPHEKQKQMQNLKHILLTLLYFNCFPSEKVSPEKTFIDLTKKIMKMMLEDFHFFDYLNIDSEYSPEAKERYERMHAYINTHFFEKIAIEKLCKNEHLTPNYLSHFFKKTSYWGLPKYVNFIRVRQAEFLLLTTDKNIYDISYEVGFSDPKFCFKYFKIWHGHTPLQHKKFYQNLLDTVQENKYYSPDDIRFTLEHYISYYFATLHVPDFWNVPFTYLRNVPDF